MRLTLLLAASALFVAARNNTDRTGEAVTADLRRVFTTAGVILGSEENGIFAFKGVPFAQPRVGALR